MTSSRQMRESPCIVLIDRRPLTQQCLIQGLSQSWPAAEITALGDSAEVLESPGLERGADLVVFNVGSARVTTPPVRRDIRRLVERFAGVPLVVLADYDECEEVVEAIQLGARGYIATSQNLAEAAEALRFVWVGGTFVPASALIKGTPQLSDLPDEGLRNARLREGLTPRETEVLARLRQGKPNKVIAHELEISESTVKVFVRSILAKLHAVNRTQVAYLTQQQFEEATAEGS